MGQEKKGKESKEKRSYISPGIEPRCEKWCLTAYLLRHTALSA